MGTSTPHDPTIDSSSGTKHASPSLLTSLHNQDLFDAWRCLHAGERDFTFFSSPHRVYTRIDLFLVDQQILSKATSASINTITWSDHASISLSIEDHYLNSCVEGQPIPSTVSRLRKIIEQHLLKFFLTNES